MDMYKVMRALREVSFSGVMIPDHVPQMIGGSSANDRGREGDQRSAISGESATSTGALAETRRLEYDKRQGDPGIRRRAETAYSIAYMKALLKRANEEFATHPDFTELVKGS